MTTVSSGHAEALAQGVLATALSNRSEPLLPVVEGVDYSIVYDPTQFVRSSIEALVHTLLEAIALVVLVVILFLQTWRASIIPLLAVPVSLIGTLGVMHLFGFGLNTLSLFGLALAIGIVVDDAIVVVENVERNISEGKTPFEATKQAMREVTGPIVLKLDCEGAEYDLLRHLMDTRADSRLELAIVEWHDPDRGREFIESNIACRIEQWHW